MLSPSYSLKVALNQKNSFFFPSPEMNLPVEKASVKVLMADSFLLLKLCWPNKI